MLKPANKDFDHITAVEKKAINLMLKHGFIHAKIGRKEYKIDITNRSVVVTISENGRGIIPCAGSKLRKMFRSVELLVTE